MWTQRTPEEVEKWRQAAANEACSHGRLIGGLVWVAVAVLAAGGWFFFMGGNAGVAIQRNVSGGFWLRLPIFGIIAAPFAYFVFRTERRKERARIAARTICPQCDSAGEGNANTPCQCGGTFVSASTMKWVEQ